MFETTVWSFPDLFAVLVDNQYAPCHPCKLKLIKWIILVTYL